MLYKEQTGSLPLKREAIAFMLKVPRLKSYIKRKQVLSDENSAEIVR
jgi:high-affinity iron transporter